MATLQLQEASTERLSKGTAPPNCPTCIQLGIYVTQHEKTGLMYTKYTYSYYSVYLVYDFRHLQAA